jgi:hypothetical protein
MICGYFMGGMAMELKLLLDIMVLVDTRTFGHVEE